MTIENLQGQMDWLLGKLAATEVTLAGILISLPKAQWKIVMESLEIAHAGGLNSEVSEYFLKGFQSVQSKFVRLKNQSPD